MIQSWINKIINIKFLNILWLLITIPESKWHQNNRQSTVIPPYSLDMDHI